MPLSRLAAAGAILACGLLAGGCGGDPPARRAAHMKRAEAFAAGGDWKAAVIEYHNALRADPSFAEGHYKLALACLRAQRPDECSERQAIRPHAIPRAARAAHGDRSRRARVRFSRLARRTS